ncbi:NPC intracellular cholesterol transporter 2-like [Phlebotomus papatasi]|uniref:MD-2-related lipid-recognition domain-containing protein n=1 Tax=Phlebotomus papatasi TaxID=29031 RepID=A0A1B0DA34_PHLPP|nr:NPC intracellular cholesterol transporter 2-like [Phlebotomus papatasi]
MIRFLILATVIPAILATQGLLRCNSGHEMPTRTTVVGCDSTPCNVQLGQSAQMEIIFTAPREITTLTPVATAFLLGIGIPYELPPEIQRGCDHIANARCPIAAGTTVTYNFELPVSANYPAVRNMPVEVALQDSQGTFSCVRVTITAVRG